MNKSVKEGSCSCRGWTMTVLAEAGSQDNGQVPTRTRLVHLPWEGVSDQL